MEKSSTFLTEMGPLMMRTRWRLTPPKPGRWPIISDSSIHQCKSEAGADGDLLDVPLHPRWADNYNLRDREKHQRSAEGDRNKQFGTN